MAIINPHDPASWPMGYNRPTTKLDPEECTQKQLDALYKIYMRGPLNKSAHNATDDYEPIMPWGVFRDAAQLDREGVLMVYWCGMWLGIEKDGHTHS